MITEHDYKLALELIHNYKVQQESIISEGIRHLQDINRNLFLSSLTPKSRFSDTNISVRTLNVLRGADIEFLEEIRGFSIKDLYKLRNMGTKSIKEIVDICLSAGMIISNK